MLDIQVNHPTYGEGVIVEQPRSPGEAPIEWQKQVQRAGLVSAVRSGAVVLVQFPKYDPRSGRSCVEAWVFRDDLSVIV